MRKSQMTYSDLKVEIVEGEGGLRVRIDGHEERLDESVLDASVLADIEQKLFKIQEGEGDLWSHSTTFEQTLEGKGQELFKAIFQGRHRKTLTQEIRRVRKELKHNLRLRLSWDPNNERLNRVGSLLWELVEIDGETIGRATDLVPSRYLEIDQAVPDYSEPLDELKILMIASEPEGSNVLADQELKAIRKSLSHESRIYVSTEKPCVSKVRQRLKDEGFHILHFVGHSHFDSETGLGQVEWATEDGSPQWLTAKKLAEHLKGIDSLRMVVLTSCSSGALSAHPDHKFYYSISPALVRAGVPAVVSMKYAITHHAAIYFSKIFYSRLASGDALDEAATEARLSLTSSMQEHEWILPSVFMQAADGQLMLLREDMPRRLRVGISNLANGFDKNLKGRVDRFLDLTEFFEEDDRTIRGGDQTLWNVGVLPELEMFLEQLYCQRRILQFNFVALWSIAFASGYFMSSKCGRRIEIVQRGQSEKVMTADGEMRLGPQWRFEEEEWNPDGNGVALVLSITNPALEEVRHYLSKNRRVPVKRIIHAEALTEPKFDIVEDGTHALQLAEEIKKFMSRRSIEEQIATLHLFCSGPNTFSFYLGQFGRHFGEVQLYEHYLGRKSSYSPSFRFPVGDVSGS